MKFIFPKNYKFSSKLLGFIDYTSAFFIIIWAILAFIIVNVFFTNINIKISLFIILFFPIFLLVIINGSRENIIFKIIYIYKFFKNRTYYLYNKNISNNYIDKKKKFLTSFLNKLLHNIL